MRKPEEGKTTSAAAGRQPGEEPDGRPPDPHERIYEEAMARIAAISEEWASALRSVRGE